ncbi:hypothetical protein ACGFMM_01825 [Streptomyces sp. NPDC048604]|uniref:hypothetical protein n=1 Tax=Streptomyces sp. NPDC048604 TaxID=3365578 RepID=UPI00371430D4
MSGGGWYVLVEGRKYGDAWELVRTVHVEGDRAQALARAAQLTRACRSEGKEWPADTIPQVGRRVFRTSEASWLVEILRSHWDDETKEPSTSSYVLRVSVAELEYAEELVPVEPPVRSRLRRALGRG